MCIQAAYYGEVLIEMIKCAMSGLLELTCTASMFSAFLTNSMHIIIIITIIGNSDVFNSASTTEITKLYRLIKLTIIFLQ